MTSFSAAGSETDNPDGPPESARHGPGYRNTDFRSHDGSDDANSTSAHRRYFGRGVW